MPCVWRSWPCPLPCRVSYCCVFGARDLECVLASCHCHESRLCHPLNPTPPPHPTPPTHTHTHLPCVAVLQGSAFYLVPREQRRRVAAALKTPDVLAGSADLRTRWNDRWVSTSYIVRVPPFSFAKQPYNSKRWCNVANTCHGMIGGSPSCGGLLDLCSGPLQWACVNSMLLHLAKQTVQTKPSTSPSATNARWLSRAWLSLHSLQVCTVSVALHALPSHGLLSFCK